MNKKYVKYLLIAGGVAAVVTWGIWIRKIKVAVTLENVRAQLQDSTNHYPALIANNDLVPVGKILEVQMIFNVDNSPTLHFNSFVEKNGYVPTALEEASFSLLALSSTGNVISMTPFDVPNRVHPPPPLPGQAAERVGEKVLQRVEFAITIPFDPLINKLRVVGTDKKIIVETSILGRISDKNNAPKFKMVRGDELTQQIEKTSYLQKLTHKVLTFFGSDTNAAPNDGYLDVVFIGDDYTTGSMNQFLDSAMNAASLFVNMEPYRTRASQVRIFFVENTADLGCSRFLPPASHIIVCNESLVIDAINSAGVPYEKVNVIFNSTEYGGAAVGSMAVSYGLINARGNGVDAVMAHEMGHTVGGLLDEYNITNTPGPITALVNQNCYAGYPPASEWGELVNSTDYRLGCFYPNWYRSSPSSIMYSIEEGSLYFNAVSKILINKRLDYYAGIFAEQSVSCEPVLQNIAINENASLFGRGGGSSYSWLSGGGSPLNGFTTGTGEFRPSYSNPGSYTVSVWDAYNSSNTSTCTVEVGIAASPIPTPISTPTPTPTKLKTPTPTPTKSFR